MAFSILSARLPGDTPICGVTLEPYIVCRRGDTNTTADDVPEEGVRDGPFLLRCRWSRSNVTKGAPVCSVHPDQEATVQCVLCLRLRVPPHLGFRCGPECLKRHWRMHRDLHATAQATLAAQQAAAAAAGDGAAAQGMTAVGSSASLVDAASSMGLGGAGMAGGGGRPLQTGSFGNGDTWVEVSKQRRYTPVTEDIGFSLRLECVVIEAGSGAELGKTVALFTARVRPPPCPPVRSMLQLAAGPSPGYGRFSVLTYNLLADLYAKSDMYPHCPAYALAWQYRKRNLLRELLAYGPDILCLQEVQSDHFADFLAPELQRAGYAAIYKKKTTELFTGSAAYAIDGCATFYRRDRFALVKKYEVEFNKAALTLAESFASPAARKSALARLLKDNVALIAVLEALDPPHPDAAGRARQLVCVANTHIHANPELNDVKLWQVHTLLKGLEKIAASADIPMLVAGDLNSTPGSAPHALLVNGRVDRAQLDATPDPLGIVRDQRMTHSLPLASAYAALADAPGPEPRLARQRLRLDPRSREPLFTNLTRDFKGTLDYVLYTRDSLAPTALLELPSEAELTSRPDEALPNANWSSDHVALMVELQYLRH